MPVIAAPATADLLPQLAGCSILGVGAPKLAFAICTGLSTWTPRIKVFTADAGTAGVGKGVPTPILLPTPLLIQYLTAGFAQEGILGLMAPPLILGLATGISQIYLKVFTNTVHSSVGVGAGLARFQTDPLVPDLLAGFAAIAAVGEGPTKMSKAIGSAMSLTFSGVTQPQPIVGTPSIIASTGVGVGTLL